MSLKRAVIVDDEQALREHIRCLLEKFWPELEICAEVADGLAALDVIAETKPDIIFLDIRMPGMSGLDVASNMVHDCHVVFITAYDQHALEAFDLHAIDYLLKPVTEARLQKTVARLKGAGSPQTSELAEVIKKFSSEQSLRPQQPLQWVRVQQGDGVQLLHVDDIAYFKACDKYTIVRTLHHEHVVRTTLKQLETLLDENKYWRIHRNAIVNLGWIEKIGHHFNGQLKVNLKNIQDKLTVSRSCAHLFRQM